MGFIRPNLHEKVIDISEVMRNLFSFKYMLALFRTGESWIKFGKVATTVGLEVLIGCVICGIALSVIGYFLSYRWILWYRNKYPNLNLRF